MKKSIAIVFIAIILSIFQTEIKAQELRSPLDPKEKTEIIPVSPEGEWSWVKAHWEWNGVKYQWVKGEYTETKNGHIWIDGEWERNNKSGWWKYNAGYWQKNREKSFVENDANTTNEERESKEKRQMYKSGGLFIKTGSSK